LLIIEQNIRKDYNIYTTAALYVLQFKKVKNMKIPLTDKFLWDLYHALEQIENVLEPSDIFRLRTFSQLCYPEKFRFWKDYEKRRRKKQFGQFINYLKKKKYIKIKNLKEGKGILLTTKGKQKALRMKYKLNPKLKKRKDKKWIMVIFDIPEKMRKYRDDFRNHLYDLGFQKLQQSVWISPYDIRKDLEEIIRIYSLDKFVRIFLIKEIEI